jgi:hypothetical protein
MLASFLLKQGLVSGAREVFARRSMHTAVRHGLEAVASSFLSALWAEE